MNANEGFISRQEKGRKIFDSIDSKSEREKERERERERERKRERERNSSLEFWDFWSKGIRYIFAE